eukprot:4535653-Karenia_brevis.AAC.1
MSCSLVIRMFGSRCVKGWEGLCRMTSCVAMSLVQAAGVVDWHVREHMRTAVMERQACARHADTTSWSMSSHGCSSKQGV